MSWLLRAFFAGTVAFKVPSYTVFLDPKVIGMGFLFFVPVIGKLATGFFAQPLNILNFFKVFVNLVFDCLLACLPTIFFFLNLSFPVGASFSFLFFPYLFLHLDNQVGFAMAAWGEIAFIIAKVAFDSDLINDELYAAVVFSVLVSALISPFILRFLLVREQSNRAAEKLREQNVSSKKGLYWSVSVTCNPEWSLFDHLARKGTELGLDVIEAKLLTGFFFFLSSFFPFFPFLSFPFLSFPFLSFPFLSFPFLSFSFLSFSFLFFALKNQIKSRNLDHSTGKLNDRIIFKDKSHHGEDPGRKQALKTAFAACVSDKTAQITVQRWYLDVELPDSADEFVHVDPDLEADVEAEPNSANGANEKEALLAGGKDEKYGGTD